MPEITFIEYNGDRYTVDVPVGGSVMEAARLNSVPGIEADCGGACACATCHVYVADEWCPVVGGPSGDEQDMLQCSNDPNESSRLSCQIRVTEALDGLVVRLPQSQR